MFYQDGSCWRSLWLSALDWLWRPTARFRSMRVLGQRYRYARLASDKASLTLSYFWGRGQFNVTGLRRWAGSALRRRCVSVLITRAIGGAPAKRMSTDLDITGDGLASSKHRGTPSRLSQGLSTI